MFLFCLYMVGFDGWQYWVLLNDFEIMKDFWVIVFDLLWYGKFFLLVGFYLEYYRLMMDKYVEIVMVFKDVMELD